MSIDGSSFANEFQTYYRIKRSKKKKEEFIEQGVQLLNDLLCVGEDEIRDLDNEEELIEKGVQLLTDLMTVKEESNQY